MKTRTLLLLLLFGFIVSCQQNHFQIINHSKPNLSVDFKPFEFENAGCKWYWPNSYECKDGTRLFELGCSEIYKESLLGALKPGYPIALCSFQFDVHAPPPAFQKEDCLFVDGGLIQGCSRLVIWKDGDYKLIKNEKELRDIYSPIESPEEALSYVLAARNVSAYYGQKDNPNFIYYVDKIEDTHVNSQFFGGYLVYVYYYHTFGCGPHETEEVVISVSHNGFLKEKSRQPVYRDPAEDGLCAD